MKLTVEKAIVAHAGLKALDGYDKIVKDGEREKVVREFYKLGSGLRLAIAKNMNRLEAVIQAFQAARNGVVFAFSEGKGAVPNDRVAEFVKEERALLSAEEDIDLVPIKSEELKLDQNPIPGSVLAQIEPLLAD